ncbi:MAG TPA: cupin domain-containing protein [Gemmatimonadaceae bacterium]
MPTSPLIAAADAPTFALPGIQFTGLAAPSRGAVESAVWLVDISPGTPGAPHQLTREEVIVALEGRARATLGGIEYEIGAGDALVVSPATDFELANPYDANFRAVAVLPVGGEGVVAGETFIPPWAR